MPRTKITAKGQVTIPKEVRERLGLWPGDELEFVEDHGKYRVKKLGVASALHKYRGFLKHLEGSDPDQLTAEIRGR